MAKKTNSMIERVEVAVVDLLMENWSKRPYFYSIPSTQYKLMFYNTSVHLLPTGIGPNEVQAVLPVDFSQIYIGDNAYNNRHLEKLLSGAHRLFLGCNVYDTKDFRQFLASVLLPAVTDPAAFLIDVVGLWSLEKRLRQDTLMASAAFASSCPGIPGAVVRADAGKLYWFDQDWVLRVSDYNPEICFAASISYGHNWGSIIPYVSPGMTFSECFLLFLKMGERPMETGRMKTDGPSPFAEFPFLKNVSISFERVSGNYDATTFNWVRVSTSVDHSFGNVEDTFLALKQRMNGIQKQMLGYLAENPHFQLYHVPISFLTLSHWVFKRNYTLECVFELNRPLWAVIGKKEG